MFLIDASPAMFRPAPASIAASGDDRVATHTIAGGSSRSFVDVAVDCARSVLRSRIVSTPNDRQGVAFFATTNTRGTADDAGANARENVWVEQRMNVPSARRIQDLADLVGADGNRRLRDKIGVAGGEENTDAGDGEDRTRHGVASYYDALLRAHHVAREMLNDHAPGAKVRKRLLLFTNRDAPLAGGAGEDGRELISAWREFRDVHRIDVTLYSLPYTAGGDGYRDFDPTVFYENLTARDDDDDEGQGVNADGNPAHAAAAAAGRELVPYAGGHELVACSADRIDGLSATFQKKSRKRRRVRTASLRFGSDENDVIAVALFAPAAEAKKPKAVNVHAKDLTELHAETRHIASADGAYVSRENLTRRFVDVGDSARAILTPADVADARRACDRESIHLLGFRPRRAIGRWARTSKPARLMVPEEESRQAGSTAAFTALCEAMVAKDRVAIAAYARTDDRFAGVRCVALVPCVEASAAADDDDDDDADDLKIIGLHVVELPYLDDLRHPELAHATGGVVAGADAIAAAEAAIEANRVNEYSPLDVPNPSLSRHYRALEIQALDRAWTESDELEAGDVTKPPDAASLEKMGIKEKMIAFKAAVYGTNHDAEALEDAAAGPGARRSGAGAGGAAKLGSGLGQTLADIDFRELTAANDLERVTVAKLKEFCAANGLAVGGAKAALCERIKGHLLGS